MQPSLEVLACHHERLRRLGNCKGMEGCAVGVHLRSGTYISSRDAQAAVEPQAAGLTMQNAAPAAGRL